MQSTKHNERQLNQYVSRRGVLAGIGSAAVVGGTGIVLFGTDRGAAATITISDIQVSDKTIKQNDGQLEAVYVTLDASWEYVSEDVEPNGIRLDLFVSPQTDPVNYDRIDQVEKAAFGFDETGTDTLFGEVTSHAGIDPSDWDAPDAGTETSIPLLFRVVFSVLEGDAVLAEAVAEDEAVLTVVNDSVAISLGVEGTGSLVVVEDSGDPTPSP